MPSHRSPLPRLAPTVPAVCTVAKAPPGVLIVTLVSADLRHLHEARRALELPCTTVLDGEQPVPSPPGMAEPTLSPPASPSGPAGWSDFFRSGQRSDTRSRHSRFPNHYRATYRLACDGGNPRVGRDLDRARIPTIACGIARGWASLVKQRLMRCPVHQGRMPIWRTPADEFPKNDPVFVPSPADPPLGPPPGCLTAAVPSDRAEDGVFARRGDAALASRQAVRTLGYPGGEGSVRRRFGSAAAGGAPRGKAGFRSNTWLTSGTVPVPTPRIQRPARLGPLLGWRP